MEHQMENDKLQGERATLAEKLEEARRELVKEK
jgi:hypothetical protein